MYHNIGNQIHNKLLSEGIAPKPVAPGGWLGVEARSNRTTKHFTPGVGAVLMVSVLELGDWQGGEVLLVRQFGGVKGVETVLVPTPSTLFLGERFPLVAAAPEGSVSTFRKVDICREVLVFGGGGPKEKGEHNPSDCAALDDKGEHQREDNPAYTQCRGEKGDQWGEGNPA